MSTTPDTTTTTNSGAGNGSGSDRSGKAAEAYQSARDKTSAAYSSAREKAGSAYGSARDTASGAARRAGEGIESNPMAAVLGGLAVGAIAGLLIPRTRQEKEYLGPVGRRITETAREAAIAAKEAGRQELGGFTDEAVGKLKSSATAAAEAARSEVKGKVGSGSSDSQTGGSSGGSGSRGGGGGTVGGSTTGGMATGGSQA